MDGLFGRPRRFIIIFVFRTASTYMKIYNVFPFTYNDNAGLRGMPLL